MTNQELKIKRNNLINDVNKNVTREIFRNYGRYYICYCSSRRVETYDYKEKSSYRRYFYLTFAKENVKIFCREECEGSFEKKNYILIKNVFDNKQNLIDVINKINSDPDTCYSRLKNGLCNDYETFMSINENLEKEKYLKELNKKMIELKKIKSEISVLNSKLERLEY